jgi:S-DNA-T family DNA segregation ATPase FtsK/SpoIIIE
VKERRTYLSYAAAATLFVLGLVLLFSLASFSRSAGTLARVPDGPIGPGAFLFLAFHWGAFFVPLYLFGCALLLVMGPFRGTRLVMLTLASVPFLTFSLLVKTLFEPAAAAAPMTLVIFTTFGRLAGAALLAVLLAVEFLALHRLSQWLASRDSSESVLGAGGTDGDRTDRLYHPDLEQVVEERPPHDPHEVYPVGDDHFEPSDGPTSPAGEPPHQLEAPAASRAAASGQWQLFAPPVDSPTEDGPHVDEALGGPVDDWPVEEEPQPDEVPVVDSFVEEAPETDDGVQVARALESSAETPQPPSLIPASRHAFDNYAVPVKNILADWQQADSTQVDRETRASGATLMQTLEEFKISAELTGIRKGPVITMFEILPSPGVKLSRIVNLADNIALRLAASPVRIVAPIPGKHAVGIEVPNKKRMIVSFREIVSLPHFKSSKEEIPIVLGKDISGEAQCVDLVQTPHLLIAGATGSGKSVCVNSIIASILYRKNPNEVKLLLIDPKIVELKLYNDIPHLLTPVITDPKRSYRALQYCIYEMERRYSLLDSLGVRDIRSYNRRVKTRRLATQQLPYIVIIVDEFADLMATSGKEMESTIARLAAMSRAVGLHLVLATQRPSVDVITGLIKANIPSRIAFMVASKFDSRIIIDTVGAEKLLGQGDMLFTSAWDPVPIRIQGAFLAEEEIESLTDYMRSLGEPDYIDEELFLDDEEEDIPASAADDPLMEKAIEIVVTAGKASASYLQRRLQVGYNRAARLVEAMEQQGIVGPPNGSKPREILYVPERSRR